MYDNRLYEVEAIMDRRLVKKSVQYLVKWLNFGPEENTWVDVKDMLCPPLIEIFENQSIKFETLNPFQRGYEAECVEDGRMESNGDIWFLVRFYDKQKLEWVSNSVVRSECPNLLIEFYETRIEWYD